MRVELSVVGAPFLDLTFEGLPRLPAPGEEVLGADLHMAPGGSGMQAVGAARLELRTALVSPVGRDPAGRLLREMLEKEGVTWVGPPAERTAITAILPADDAAAMATFLPPGEVSQKDVASVQADAVILSLGRLPLRPPNAAFYVVTGPIETGRFGPSDLPALERARAVVMNEREASTLCRTSDAASAARTLARHAEVAVVTRGARGAVASEGGSVLDVQPPAVVAADATGAGDLFVAGYVWADRSGADLEGRVRWATLYAALSTTAPSALAGALRLDRLLAEGERRGLSLP